MSQLREHLRYTWQHRLRAMVAKWRLGKLGEKVNIDKRVEFLRFPKNIWIGDEVVVKEGVKLCSCNAKAIIRVGKRTTLGYYTYVFASEKIEIGDDCLIAPFVYIVDSNHTIGRDLNINLQPNETSPITIGRDVWIAGNVTILKGVTIGDGAVIAANSVVNTNVLSYEIWGGSPARKIGERK